MNDKPGWLTANQKYYPVLKTDREKLKKDMTPSEKKLWEEMRNKKLGVKFRRQHVIDCFIVDFVCLPLKLIVEVDGEIHKYQKSYDNMREDQLKLLGYTIIRFSNDQVSDNIFVVKNKIKDMILNLQLDPAQPPQRGGILFCKYSNQLK